MGIIVCLALLAGLVQMWTQRRTSAAGVAWVLVVLGLWNAGWYGLRHLNEFWGWAALFSGICMLLGAILVAGEASPKHPLARWYPPFSNAKILRSAVLLGLLLSFLLYAVTLIQLNLGMAIIR